MRHYFRYATLRPYGAALLTPAADFWIFAVRIAILLMASSEGVSWAYAAFFMTSGGLRWVVGSATYFVVATLIWLLDSSLMTLDRWARQHDHQVTLAKPSGWFEHLVELASVGGRVGMVAASMIITAPFLTQLMFKGDIDRALLQERSSVRMAQRQALVKESDSRLGALERLIDDGRERLDREVAGIGGSRRYGDGVAAGQVRGTIAVWEAERTALQHRKREIESAFDALSDADVASKYGVTFPGDTFQERGRILKKIENDNYARTELAVRTFLGFLFLALVILKLFAPRSVNVYFSERLHALYDQYSRGAFDASLAPEERVWSGGGMAPLRFEDWALNIYPALRAQDISRMEAGFYTERIRDLEDVLRRIRSDEQPVRDIQLGLTEDLKRVDVDLAAAARQLGVIDRREAEILAYRKTLEKGISEAGTPTSMTAALQALDKMHENYATLQNERREAQTTHGRLKFEADALRKRLANNTVVLEELEKSRRNAEQEISAARHAQVEGIGHIVEGLAFTAGRGLDASGGDTAPSGATPVM